MRALLSVMKWSAPNTYTCLKWRRKVKESGC